MNKIIELKRCSHCGSGLVSFKKTNKHGTRGYAYCMECGLRTETKYDDRDDSKKWKQKAAESWNTRKPMDRIVERLGKQIEVREEILEESVSFMTVGELRNEINAFDKAIEIVKAGEVDG